MCTGIILSNGYIVYGKCFLNYLCMSTVVQISIHIWPSSLFSVSHFTGRIESQRLKRGEREREGEKMCVMEWDKRNNKNKQINNIPNHQYLHLLSSLIVCRVHLRYQCQGIW